jgi:GNAT superfamily N-acetyltransferase
MINITTATLEDIPIINQLANEIWWPSYKDYIPALQISLMLDELFSAAALQQQFSEGSIFKLLNFEEAKIGFASYSETGNKDIYKLHRLYLHPKFQNLGLGKDLLSAIENEVIAKGGISLELNVNRGNKAQFFYLKMGYQIVTYLDIPYHNYILNDFLLEKKL